MYLEPLSDVYQGDILDQFLFSTIPQPPPETLKSSDESLEDYEVKPRLTLKQAMIVTQTCDAVRREFISVAPIFPIDTYTDALRAAGKKEENLASELSQLKKQKIKYYYYIPGDLARGVDEGYVDLTFINPLERVSLQNLKRIARLKDYPRHVLAYKLGNLYMRPH